MMLPARFSFLLSRPWILIVILALFLSAFIFVMLVVQPSTFFNEPPFPVPESARWVRYKGWGMWIAFEELARFSAPRDHCLPAAEAIMEEWRQENPQGGDDAPTYIGKSMITSSERRSSEGPWWFAPHTISHGYILGATNAFTLSPDVWVDLDRGIVYYHHSD